MSDDVIFWFDPICPFTWRTSRWLREVTTKRNLVVSWRLLSLATLNAENDVPEQYRDLFARGWRAARLLVAAGEKLGQPAVDRLYTEIGTRLHGFVGPGAPAGGREDGAREDGAREDGAQPEGAQESGRTLDTDLLAEALAAAELPAELIESADDNLLDQMILDSHAEAQARVGVESGSPILALGDGPGFFGPVVSPVPEGEAAEKLFDAVRLLSAVPEFSEIKRARNPL